MVRTVTNIYAICAFAAIGGGLFGFDISSMSGVLGTNAYKNYFNNPQGTKVSSGPYCQSGACGFAVLNGVGVLARRYHLCHASWVISWVVDILLSWRPTWSKARYPDWRRYLDHWINVNCLPAELEFVPYLPPPS